MGFGFGYGTNGGSASGSGGEKETFTGDGVTKLFTTTFTASANTMVFLGSDLVTSDQYTRVSNGFTLNDAPFDGAILTIKN